ncbi:uncharacterized protein J7T54_008414 [Emericellopsis cladophorae]|uniref:C2H2-type domain-containing protein n=1 Tax=Emericellopsis cladophorae TaxID=2686198 RepID=A0A9P9Y368_9HYPO|nr:uncharacterized protein J7T54_008414 [Emericellopsis cladophorae]KAI6782328.1 hypothetical protein J7T54_008414 [Emericellopsis cladophorae]
MNQTRSPAASLNALLNAPPHQVRATLLALCGDRSILKKALKYKATLQSQPAILQPWICVRCKAAFDANNNPENACRFHPSDHSSEVWADTDDWMFEGLSEDEGMLEEKPEGYSWGCCGGHYDSKPCAVGKHSAYSEYVLQNASEQGVVSISGDEHASEGDLKDLEQSDEDGDSDGGSEPPSKKRKA